MSASHHEEENYSKFNTSFGQDDKYVLASLKITQVKDLTDRIIARELRSIGTTPEKAFILLEVVTSPEPLTPVKISKVMRRNPAAVSKILSRMHHEGSIKLVKNPKNKHLLKIEITPKGEQLYTLVAEWFKYRKNPWTILSESEIDIINELLTRVDKHSLNLYRPGTLHLP
jgi:MarR family multiple antibiotic resistance transcriptional regulator